MRFFKNIDMDKVLENKKQIIILFSLGLTLILTIVLCLLFTNNKSYVATYKPLEEESQLNQNDLIASENASQESGGGGAHQVIYHQVKATANKKRKKLMLKGLVLAKIRCVFVLGKLKCQLLQCHRVMRPISPKNGPVVMKV